MYPDVSAMESAERHRTPLRFIRGTHRSARARTTRALEISDAVVTALSHQGEDGALRVRALDDPSVARHFDRAAEHLAVAGLHAFHRLIDIADVEVVKPEGDWLARRLGKHAADGLPPGREQLIRADRAGVEVCLSPTKELAVESPRFLPVGGKEIVPADAAQCVHVGGLRLIGMEPLNIAIVAICGSTAIEKRLTLGTSFGGTCRAPPSSLMRSAAASTSLTPTYPSQPGLKPHLLASSGRPVTPLTGSPPAVNRV